MKKIINNITYKIFILIFSIMIAMLIILSSINFYITRERLYNRLELQAFTLLEGLNYSVEGLLFNKDTFPIQRLLTNLAASKEVNSIGIVNRDLVFFADSIPENIGKKTDNPLIVNVLKTEKMIKTYMTDKDGLKELVLIRPLRGKDYSIKLRSDVVGVIYLEMSTSAINDKLINDFLSSLFFIAIITIVMFFYTILILRKILINPIKRVEHYTHLIAEGNLNIEIPKTSDDEIGQLIDHLNSMTRDISKLTDKLANTNSYLESIYTSMRNMLFVTDKQGIIKNINQMTQSLLAFEEHELIGKSIYDLMVKSDNLASHQLINNEEIHFITKKGPTITTLTSSSFTKSQEGTILGMVFVSQDLTKYKELEEKIHSVKEAIIISRQAGMAEIANNVLHNIGNVLNSVNTSANLLASRLINSDLNRLPKIDSLLQENLSNIGDFITHDPKGKLFPNYINQLSHYWEEEHQFFLKECESLLKSIQHIKEIVVMQQSIAGSFGVIEKIELPDLIENAINIAFIDLISNQIKIIKEYEPVDPIFIDKSKLLQIFINLLKNAKEALLSSGALEKTIIIRLKQYDEKTLQIQIIDNGPGILAENLAKLFTQGFTTKPKGHGFGLHSCIFTANELQGSLSVASEGLNKGAVFTLQLPYQREAVDIQHT